LFIPPRSFSSRKSVQNGQVEMEETLSLVRAEALALDARNRADAKARDAAKLQAKVARRASLSAATAGSSDARGASAPASQSRSPGGAPARGASVSRGASVARHAAAPKIVAWRGGTQIKDVELAASQKDAGSLGLATDPPPGGVAAAKAWGLFGGRSAPKKPADLAPASAAIEAAIKAARAADDDGGGGAATTKVELKRPLLKRPGSRDGSSVGDGKESGESFSNPMLHAGPPAGDSFKTLAGVAGPVPASEDALARLAQGGDGARPTPKSSIQAKKEAKEKADQDAKARGPGARPNHPAVAIASIFKRSSK
jgi:hypothetical protein